MKPDDESSNEISAKLDAILKREEARRAAWTPEERKAHEDRVKQEEQDALNCKIESVRHGWNAPKRHLIREVDRTGAFGTKEAELLKKLGTGFLVGLVGGRGPGKTQMGVELMKSCTQGLKTARYNTLTGLFLEIKAAFKPNSRETEEELVERLTRPSLLVIDEVGRKSDGEWENRIFFELIDRRYRQMRDTLLIANQSKEQFLKTIGESLASRMQETGGVIECNWESYRL